MCSSADRMDAGDFTQVSHVATFAPHGVNAVASQPCSIADPKKM